MTGLLPLSSWMELALPSFSLGGFLFPFSAPSPLTPALQLSLAYFSPPRDGLLGGSSPVVTVVPRDGS